MSPQKTVYRDSQGPGWGAELRVCKYLLFLSICVSCLLWKAQVDVLFKCGFIFYYGDLQIAQLILCGRRAAGAMALREFSKQRRGCAKMVTFPNNVYCD